jgi:N-formylmaleamate deformylase
MNLPEGWSAQVLEIEGARFHYTRTGGVGKPSLVLNHGFSDHGLCWARVARDLEADYDIFMPDARGHGSSARVQPGQVFDRTEDMAGLFRALGLKSPVVMGHSLGAGMSAQLAARYPDIPRALLLEDPPWNDVTPPWNCELRPRPHLEWMATMPGRTMDDLIAERLANDPQHPPVELEPWAESKLMFDQNLLKAAAAPFIPWREVARDIRCPTLLISSDVERGAIVSPAVAEEAMALNPLLRWAYIPGTGHDVRRGNYEGYLRAVRGFLAEL